MQSKNNTTIVTVAGLGIIAGIALAAQDRYTLKVPNGLAFSEFRGYDNWPVIAISEHNGVIAAILGNPVIINPFRAGIPGNGKPFPGGSKMAKVQWLPKKERIGPRSAGPSGHHVER